MRVRHYSAVASATLAIAIILTNGAQRGAAQSTPPQQSALEIRVAPAPTRFEPSTERLARGKYLAEGIAGCLNCHSEKNRVSRPEQILPGKTGAGSNMGRGDDGFFVIAPNLTPDPETGSGKWTDNQWTRAIRQGIGHDGRTLYPMMPYRYFNAMSDEDLASIVAYLRTLPPVRSEWHATVIPANIAAMLRPSPAPGQVPSPNRADAAKYGAYLVSIGHCEGCHSPTKDDQPIPGLEFSGGRVFPIAANPRSGQMVATPNLTPDPSGISYYDTNIFIKTVRTGAVNGVRELDNMMPWSFLRNATDADLADMFSYLRSLKPVAHRIDNGEPPTLCPIDGNMHGLGATNSRSGH